MNVFAVMERRSSPVAHSRPQPSRIGCRSPEVKAQQAQIGFILRYSGAQAKLNIGQPNDKYGQEADRVAEQVMRMPEPKHQRACACGGTCPKCKTEQERDRLQTKRIQARNTGEVAAPPIVHDVLRSSGQPLQPATRTFMETRFGQDFSQVRIHADAKASESVRAVNASAYTLGRNVVFGAGQYSPDTEAGKRLLAHELTHVKQQEGDQGIVQRDVVIEPTPAATDPAHDMPVEDQRDIVRTLVQKLCPDFDVPASSPLRVEGMGTTCDDIQNGTSLPHTGCCCLCVLTTPGANRWTIIISQNESPHTNPSSHTVVINPSGSPIESLHWTDASGAGERMIDRPRVITFGHELCGHAALMEIGSHPVLALRTSTDVHNPTIKIERLIWGEQGLPSGEQRGLAAGGTHRGESVYRLTLDRFPLNGYDVRLLPASEQAELAELKRFSSNWSWYMEVHGHSDHAGSPAAKMNISDRRAAAVRSDLASAPNGSNYTFVSVVGHSDDQPITGARAAELRRVDVILSLFRAGVPTPPSSASPATQVGPSTPLRHARNLSSADICIRHLAAEAWR